VAKASADEGAKSTADNSALDRIAKLLALLATKGETQREQIVTLSRVGFSNAELAQILGTTSEVVASTLYQSRNAPKPRKKKD
jgi:DNA-directed RNA polymerase specialized sigma24 family protein